MIATDQYKNLLADIQTQNYTEVPLDLTQAELNNAAEDFLAFFKLPLSTKQAFSTIIDPDDPGSNDGYTLKSRSRGDNDNKEYFHYRKLSTELHKNQLIKHKDNTVVRQVFASADRIFWEATKGLEGIIKTIDAAQPGIHNKVFSQDSERYLCLRFIKYDSAEVGDFLAKAHYDRGSSTLALAESAPGLRLGRTPDTLKEVEHKNKTALFMPAYTFAADTGVDHFTPTWHDVVQKSADAYNQQIARWAIVLFSDVGSTSHISYDDNHIPKDY